MLKAKNLAVYALAMAMSLGVAACAGDTGPEGQQGEMGEQGEQGEQGDPGDDGADGEDGVNSLVETEEIDPGDECADGGVRVNAGLDADGDGSLSDDEIADGSSTVVCHAEGYDCAGPFEITGVSNLDQTFYEGVQSDPLTIETDSDGDISAEFISMDVSFAEAGNPGEYTATPAATGGPFEVVVIASNACAVDTSSFTIDNVEPAVATARAVHLYEAAGLVDIALTGETDPLFTLDFLGADGPIQVEPDTYEFDVLDIEGDVLATSPQLDLNLGGEYTLVAHPDAAGDVAFLQLEDDLSDAGSDVRLRAINANPDLSEIDIVSVASDDSTTDMFTDVAFGQAADADTFAPDIERIGLDTDDDGTADFVYLVNSEMLEEVGNFNLFTFGDDALPRLIAQNLDNSSDTRELTQAASLPVSFEGASFPSFVVIGGDTDWEIDDTDGSDGTSSASSGDVGNGERSWMELSFYAPTDGDLEFDWKVSSESCCDELVYCIDQSGVCRDGTDDGQISGTEDWTTVTVPVTAGAHIVRWAFDKDGSVSSGEDMGWVDNIRFSPTP